MARAMSLVVLLAANAASPALAAKGARRLSSITGYVMTDSNIFDAVELWLLDEDAADIKYGHITAWDTSAVTDMSCLFKAEEDNGGQCTYPRFYHAAAASFDEDLSGWDVGNVRKMAGIFVGAEAFDQDLGWCVAADDLDEEQGAFYGSKCASTNCGVAAGQYPAGGGCGATPAPAATYDGTYHTDASLRTAVAAWLANATAAEATYGHISTWKTGKVTDMSQLFWQAGGDCAFNEDISAWDTSQVVTMAGMFGCDAGEGAFNRPIGAWDVSSVEDMSGMFQYASSFNQDLSGWSPISVKDMRSIFEGATAFDQDLGWCKHVSEDLGVMTFAGTPCESQWCGISLKDEDGVAVDFKLFDDTKCWWNSCGVQDSAAGTCAPTAAPTLTPRPTATRAPTVSPLVADDATIRTAVDLWLSDRAAAEATYGHISKWVTGGVTDMSYLFCAPREDDDEDEDEDGTCHPAAAAFNEDISAWDTSGVVTMSYLFYGAAAFNQTISGWRVDKVAEMDSIFKFATAFDQDLAWCLDADIKVDRHMFGPAWTDSDPAGDVAPRCASTACGVLWGGGCDTPTGDVMVNWKLRRAVRAWLDDAAAAEATYGHISTWDTSLVTDLHCLFAAAKESGCWYYNAEAASFDEHLEEWDVSHVDTMWNMFNGAASFDQYLGDWDVSNVKDMNGMFAGASAFDQPLGWCVDEDAELSAAFDDTPCSSTSCGVEQGQFVTASGSCESTPAPTAYFDGVHHTDASIREAVAEWLVDPTGTEAGYGHISAWETSAVTDMSELFIDAHDFNEDIGAWDISGVTSFRDMFKGALAFNQTLGWCLEDMEDADIDVNTFKDTPCESTNCGVAEQGAGCFLPTPRPTPAPPSAAPTAPPTTAETAEPTLAPSTAELVPVPTYSPAPSPVPGSPTQRPTPGPSPALTTAPTTPAPTPTQTAVQITSSVTLEGIVATEFNSDEGLKAAFAQSIIDSSDGVFDDVVDVEAAERRRLADGAGVEISYTGVTRVDGTDNAEQVSAELLEQSMDALTLAIDDGSFLTTLQASDPAFSAVAVDVDATHAAIEAASYTFVVMTPRPVAAPTPMPDGAFDGAESSTDATGGSGGGGGGGPNAAAMGGGVAAGALVLLLAAGALYFYRGSTAAKKPADVDEPADAELGDVKATLVDARLTEETPDGVAAWLRRQDLPGDVEGLCSAVVDKRVSGADFAAGVDEDYLKELGVATLGLRKAVVRAVREERLAKR